MPNRSLSPFCPHLQFALFLVFASCSSERAPPKRPLDGALQGTADPRSGATADEIPAGYVSGPGGWTHPSCIHEIPNGATFDADHGDVIVDGKVIAHYPPCAYRPIMRNLARAAAPLVLPTRGPITPGGGPAIGPSWVESTMQMAPAGQKFTYLVSDMHTPATPAQTTPETFYYFPGLVSTLDGGCGILQPVLQWGGNGPAGGGAFWALASWWWGHANQVHTPLMQIGNGETIRGSLGMYSGNAFNDWFADTTRPNTGGTHLNIRTTCRFNQAFPAVLEVDSPAITNCDQLPRNLIDFTGIRLFSEPAGVTVAMHNNEIGYSPTPQFWTGNTAPNCGWGIGETDLTPNTSTTLWTATLWSGDAQPTGCGTIPPGRALVEGNNFSSCDGRFTLWMQRDGNLVLYQNGVGFLWASNTDNSAARAAVMQLDGNFVVYDQTLIPSGSPWSTGTSGNNGAQLTILNNGNMVVQTPAGATLWQSNTCCH